MAHALADSPAGQLAWTAHLLAGTSDEHVITNAALYWLTNTVRRPIAPGTRTSTPSTRPSRPLPRRAWASFANDFRPVRRFAERDHKNIVSWNEDPRGGRWVTQDAPDLLLDATRQFFRRLR